MKQSEIAAKLGAAVKTEAELVAALDATIALANQSGPILAILRQRLGKADATNAELLSFANGDYPGHPFHGNQFVDKEAAGKSESGTGAHHLASKAAHEASKAAKTTAEHRKAAHLHMKAAKLHEEEGNDKTAAYHEAMAADHLHAAGSTKRDRDYLESKYGSSSKANEALANGTPVVPHEGMTPGADLIGDLHKQLANCIELGKTKANEYKTKVAEVLALANAKAEVEKSLANERRSRTDLMIEVALKDGKITLAEKETWQKEFANEATYQSAVDRYAKLTPKVPTRTNVERPGAQHAATANRQEQIETFVNEAMEQRKLPHLDAYAAVQKEHPELFAGMQEPSRKDERATVI